jgi:probable phosphoglycerate mutase
MAQEIWIIRHGETDSNAARVVQLPSALLSAQGREQAALLATRAADAGVARILSSDLERARHTAEAIATATGAPLSVDELLRERDYGDLRGTPYAELGGLNIFAHEYEPPGGESGEVFQARVDRAWARVVEVAGEVEGRLLVVTHGLVCAAFVERHVGGRLAVGDAYRNTSVTIVRPGVSWDVVRINCTNHLDAVADGGIV